MRPMRAVSTVKAKLAVAVVVGTGLAAVATPAALALNPQPLPPRASTTQPAKTPILIGGFLTCHEYGCL